ncbi:6716_t:CDS:2 [Diversispora eburnea]|uniref:6716_t:CDS:1 n=1 Tax=Diversispora eburnea TaxID=1213867 RepID=A0A9N8VHK3_9GLOM|nr:6716_t:CDS:2 [Diversispora eburnea]
MALTPPSRNSCEELRCLWAQCGHSFDDPELLYNHLANDHVGRKSTGNLCLSCHWDRCEVQTTKRDHITSHLRVHVPLKPHICESCKKAFKRPQDLKKHEKIHTPEHQNHMIKQRFNRDRGRNQPPTPPHQYSSGDSSASSPQQVPLSPDSNTSSVYISNQDIYYYSDYPDYPDDVDYQFQPVVSIPRNSKRNIEVFDEFCHDVKRKRIDPLYNEVLVDKLENLSKAFGDEEGIDQISLASFSTKEDFNVISDFLEQTLRAMNNNDFNIHSEINTNNSYPDSTILSYPSDTFTTTTTNNTTDTGSLYSSLNLDIVHSKESPDINNATTTTTTTCDGNVIYNFSPSVNNTTTNVPVVCSNDVVVENLYPITATTGLTGGVYNNTAFPSPPEDDWDNVYPIYPSTTATVPTTVTTTKVENNVTKNRDIDELTKKVSDLKIGGIKKIDKEPNLNNNNKYNEALRQKHLAFVSSVHKKIGQLAEQFETTSTLGSSNEIKFSTF